MNRTKQQRLIKPRVPSKIGEPTWEIAYLFPRQGEWTEEEYLALTEWTKWMVELSDGQLEVLHVPEDAPRARHGQPTWEVAYLFPRQGDWSETEYLALDTNWLVELSEGCLEVLPMPTPLHQAIAFYLARVLADFVESRGLGRVLPAPFQVLLWKGKFREPDVAYLRGGKARTLRAAPRGVDLAIEVVSEGRAARDRDYRTKRREYARAGIPEYWIVDPEKECIVVLKLVKKRYQVHGVFGRGQLVTSASLQGFSVAIDAVFAAARD